MLTSHIPFPATLLCLFLPLLDATSARPSPRNSLLYKIRATPPDLSVYSPVLTDGSQSLPPPIGTVAYITLGRGTQNYTCSSATSTPISNGATATLFDATHYLSSFSVSAGQDYLNNLPTTEVDSTTTKIKDSGLPIIGRHFFTAAGVPTWELSPDDDGDDDDDDELLLYGSSVGDIPAPEDANPGPLGTGAVDWKALTAAAGSVGGLKEVYRVETAGGKAPGNCNGFDEGTTVQVQYAAMYWFYG